MLLVVKFALRAYAFAENLPISTFHHIDKARINVGICDQAKKYVDATKLLKMELILS